LLATATLGSKTIFFIPRQKTNSLNFAQNSQNLSKDN
jgi:hypothetical protein